MSQTLGLATNPCHCTSLSSPAGLSLSAKAPLYTSASTPLGSNHHTSLFVPALLPLFASAPLVVGRLAASAPLERGSGPPRSTSESMKRCKCALDKGQSPSCSSNLPANFSLGRNIRAQAFGKREVRWQNFARRDRSDIRVQGLSTGKTVFASRPLQ